MNFKNMKIKVENNLDEIVAELERLGYKKVGWIGYRNTYFITTNTKGQFTDHAVSLINCFAYCELTTLAELKSMSIDCLKEMK